MSLSERLKVRLYNLIRDDDENDLLSTIIDGFIIFLIVVNMALVVLDTFPMPLWYTATAFTIEAITVAIFTIEYLARVWTATLMYPKLSHFKARVKYMFGAMAIIDLVAIIPFYLPFVITIDALLLKLLRTLRLLRLFKINRYTTSLKTIGAVFTRRANQLLSSSFIILLLMIIASVLMYTLEHDVQPDLFKNAFSGLWWSVATFTTVGYGDIFPVTDGGKLVAGMLAILGIGLVAVPTGIISAGFIEQTEIDRAAKQAKKEKTFVPQENKNALKEIVEAKKLLDKKILTKGQFEALKEKIIKS
jgi:voltage-gated potassium channel